MASKELVNIPYKYHQDYSFSPTVKYWGIGICTLTSMLILYFK